MIKAIIFDFGRVISAPKPESLFLRYETELGLAPGMLNTIMFGSQAWDEVLVGQITMDEYWCRMGPSLGLRTPEAIAGFGRRYNDDEAINTPVLDIVERLRREYKVGVLSNCPPGLAAWLAKWKILHLFDTVVCSGDEGVAKPDAAIFHRILDRLQVAPREAIFVDDTLGHVEAAQALGLHGIHFTTAAALQDELDRILAAQRAADEDPH